MQLLTTLGYKNIEDCSIGEQLIAYDITDGHIIINELQAKQWMSADMFEDQYDENGNLIKTKEEIYIEVYGDISFYKINNTWTLYGNQSIWANLIVNHVKNLQVGDIVYNDTDGDIAITSIEEVTGIGWWRLTVSGDHSYIADNLTLHNASRYWVGGGSSANWNATGNTNWGSTSGGANNQSVPTSVDDVTFDGVGTNGNTNSTISATITIQSLNITSGYTATMTHNASLTVGGNITLNTGYTIAGSSDLTLSSTNPVTINTNGKVWPNNFIISAFNTGVITLSSNLTINGLFTQQTSNQVINKTTSEAIICNGGFVNGARLTGTISIYLRGGSWTGGGPLSVNLFLDGNITLGSPSSNLLTFGGGAATLKYLSGTIVETPTLTFYFGASDPAYGTTASCDISAITLNNVVISSNITHTLTLLSNLNVNTLTIGYLNSNAIAVNKTTTERINVNTSLITSNLPISLTGTVDMYLKGGTWFASIGVITSIRTNLFLDGNVTISGNVYYGGNTLTHVSGTITVTGSTLNIVSDCSLNTSTMSWNNFASNTTAIVTLVSDLYVSSLTSPGAGGGSITFNNNKVYVSNGISLNFSRYLGTSEIVVTGGTIQLTGGGITQSFISNLLTLNGNVTITTLTIQGTLRYVSGTITVTSSTLVLGSGAVLDSSLSGITWNNVYIWLATITLNHNLNLSGILYSIGGGTCTINKTTSEVVTANGLSNTTESLTGTADIYLTGGTWESALATSVSNNLFINGNITLGTATNPYSNIGGGTLTYQSGTITQIVNLTTRINGACTLNTAGMAFNNFVINTTGNITLTSNLTINGLFSSAASQTGTFNKTANEIVIINGGLSPAAIMTPGTADMYLRGGTWAGSSYISNNLFIDGPVTLGTNFYYRTGTLTYLSGTVRSTGATLNLASASCTINNFHKIPLKQVTILAGLTITMNEFFTGTASQICQVTSSGVNYTISFSDNFEKIAKHVAIFGCSLNVNRRQQLLILSRYKSNFNRGTNIGIRYINQSPNGFSKNESFITTGKQSGLPGGLVADPNFVKQG